MRPVVVARHISPRRQERAVEVAAVAMRDMPSE